MVESRRVLLLLLLLLQRVVVMIVAVVIASNACSEGYRPLRDQQHQSRVKPKTATLITAEDLEVSGMSGCTRGWAEADALWEQAEQVYEGGGGDGPFFLCHTALPGNQCHLQTAKLHAAAAILSSTPGVLSSRLEQLLALLYKPAHITNAACETALKPLSSSGVEKMSPEQVAAHVKAHIEDLDTWVPHITRESLAESRVEDRVAKRQRKEDKQAAAVAFFGKASPSLATAHPSPVAAAATPSPTAATSTSVCKRSVGSITVSLASLEARSACGQTATMQQEEAKQYAADKATDKGRHLQAVALYRCKLACNKLPPTTSKLLKNQLQELWAVVGNGQPTVKPVRNMHIVDWLDALAVHMSPVTN
ncbi:hypothetical protein V8C86DRAFT_3036140 [Haematococcus lacustris]